MPDVDMNAAGHDCKRGLVAPARRQIAPGQANRETGLATCKLLPANRIISAVFTAVYMPNQLKQAKQNVGGCSVTGVWPSGKCNPLPSEADG
jgi:hypothetical protein